MPQTVDGSPVHSLAGIRPGESVEIRLILFDSLRSLCRDLGLTEGTVVECHAQGRLHLILRTASVPTILLERDWARFIQVTDLTARPIGAAGRQRVNGGRSLATVSRVQAPSGGGRAA